MKVTLQSSIEHGKAITSPSVSPIGAIAWIKKNRHRMSAYVITCEGTDEAREEFKRLLEIHLKDIKGGKA